MTTQEIIDEMRGKVAAMDAEIATWTEKRHALAAAIETLASAYPSPAPRAKARPTKPSKPAAATAVRPAHPTGASPRMSAARTAILALLTTPLTLTELATKAKKKDSTIHHHVKALTSLGLVVRERHGRNVRYRQARGSRWAPTANPPRS